MATASATRTAALRLHADHPGRVRRARERRAGAAGAVQAVGVDAAVQLHDGTSISQLWFSGKFDAMLHWWQLPADPELTLFFAKDRMPPHGRNINYMRTTRSRAGLRRRSQRQPGERAKVLAEAQTRIAELAIEIPLYWVIKLDAIRRASRASPAIPPTPGRSGTSTRGRSTSAGWRAGGALEAVPLLLIVSGIAFAMLHSSRVARSRSTCPTRACGPRTSSGCAGRSASTARSWSSTSAGWRRSSRGDWGYSFSDGRPVLARVVERVPASGSSAGALVWRWPRRCRPASWRPCARTWVDRTLTAVAAAGVRCRRSGSGHAAARFAIGLRWLPSSGRGATATWWTGCSTWCCPPVLAAVHARGVVPLPSCVAGEVLTRPS